VNINPIGPEEDPQTAQYCAVGLWTEISVRLLRVPSLEEVKKELLGGGQNPNLSHLPNNQQYERERERERERNFQRLWFNFVCI
jgi:hypothetical protein